MKEQMTTANSQLLATLENSRNYTMSVASAMPEKDYHFKPAGAGWDFNELLNHIAYGIEWWQDNFIKGVKSEWSPPTTRTNKKETISYLQKAYDSLQKGTEDMDENGVNGFHATLDHITHHRGQAVLYLRCAGQTPPEYLY